MQSQQSPGMDTFHRNGTRHNDIVKSLLDSWLQHIKVRSYKHTLSYFLSHRIKHNWTNQSQQPPGMDTFHRHGTMHKDHITQELRDIPKTHTLRIT